MSDIYIAKENFPGVIERLMGRYRVYAPVKNGRSHEFAPLENAAEADLGFQQHTPVAQGDFSPAGRTDVRVQPGEGRPAGRNPQRGAKRISRPESFSESGRATQKLFSSMTPTSTPKP